MKKLINYDFTNLYSQIDNGKYLRLIDDLWDSLNSEEWKDVNPLKDFMKNTDRGDLRYIQLNISKLDRFGLSSMDENVNDKYMIFRTELNDKYKGKYLDIIDYKEGKIYIIKKR